MKRIDKIEPDIYRSFLEQKHPIEWAEVSCSIGSKLREYMLSKEQKNQCAYTELCVSPDNTHIDHFRKQSLFPKLKFEWKNLLASCNSDRYGARYKDKRVKKEDYQSLINPVDEDPNDYLSYSLTGNILAKENNQKAIKTIEYFNLNDHALLEQRKQVIHYMRSMYKQCSADELVRDIGKFESLVRAVYSDLWEIGERTGIAPA